MAAAVGPARVARRHYPQHLYQSSHESRLVPTPPPQPTTVRCKLFCYEEGLTLGAPMVLPGLQGQCNWNGMDTISCQIKRQLRY